MNRTDQDVDLDPQLAFDDRALLDCEGNCGYQKEAHRLGRFYGDHTEPHRLDCEARISSPGINNIIRVFMELSQYQ